MKASDIFGKPSPEVIHALGIDAGYVQHKRYSHTLELAGRPLARCVGSDCSTDPHKIMLVLCEGVTEKEIRKLSIFEHMDIEIVCPECEGTGEVSEDVLDHDSMQYMSGVGSRKCLCQTQN